MLNDNGEKIRSVSKEERCLLKIGDSDRRDEVVILEVSMC
jgi:hypothetical protein